MSNSIEFSEIALTCPLCGKRHVYKVKLGVRREYVTVFRDMIHYDTVLHEIECDFVEQEILLYCPVVRDYFKFKLKLSSHYYFLGVDEISVED